MVHLRPLRREVLFNEYARDKCQLAVSIIAENAVVRRLDQREQLGFELILERRCQLMPLIPRRWEAGKHELLLIAALVL